MSQGVIERFLKPDRLASRAEVLATPCPVPAEPGVYGWWFRLMPTSMDTHGCVTTNDCTLLYVGISPKRPPANGKPPSTENLRKRIRYHYTGNAEGSTLRKTLGCLLSDELGIELRRVGSGRRMTFAVGEQSLSTWLARNALVNWVPCDAPWEVEARLIADLDLPLNLDANAHNPFYKRLKAVRAEAVEQARSLPIMPNPGVGGS